MANEPIPRWKTFQLLNGAALKQVQQVTATVQTSLDVVKESINVVDQVLSAVQQMVAILKVIEQVVDQDIFSFLNMFINTIDSLLDSIRSTGIYGLDLFSYHFQDLPAQYNDANYLLGNEWWKEALIVSAAHDVTDSSQKASNEAYASQLTQLNALLNGMTGLTGTPKAQVDALKNKIDINLKALKNNQKTSAIDTIHIKEVDEMIKSMQLTPSQSVAAAKVLEYIFLWRYKPETYYEWIDVICDAFTDPKDKPGRPIMQLSTQAAAKSQDTTGNDLIPKVKTYGTISEAPAILKSGRPLFNSGDQTKVILVGFNTPSLEGVKDIWDAIKNLGDLFAGKTKIGFEEFKMMNNPDGTTWSALKQNLGHELYFAADSVEYGPEPNFVGLTIGTVFNDLFKYVEMLFDYARSLYVPLPKSIFDSIASYIKTIKSWVSKAEFILKIIQQIVTIISAFIELTKGYVLVIETNEGVPGVIKQLKTAKPFTTTRSSLNNLLKMFNLQGNPDAILAISKDAYTKTDMVNNLKSYTVELNNQRAEIQKANSIASTTFNKLTQDLEKLQNLYSENQAFDVALAASNYNTLYQAMTLGITQRDGIIASFINLMNGELTAHGSIQWIEDQIVLYATELAATSAFNITNSEVQASINASITALDNQHADPNAPLLPNYTTDRAALVANLTVIQGQKTTHDTIFNDLYNRYVLVLNLVNAFIASHPIVVAADAAAYDIKIAELQGDVDASKLNRLNDYNIYETPITGLRAVALNNIVVDQLDIKNDNADIAIQNGNIAQWTAEAQFWTVTETPVRPHQSDIDIRNNVWIPAAQAAIVADLADIALKEADILVQQANIVSYDAHRISYDAIAVANQEDIFNEWNALTHWKLAEGYRLHIADLNAELASYMQQQDLVLSTLLNDIISPSMPSLSDSSYSATVLSLQTNEGYDIIMPDATRVQNAIAKINQSGGQLEAAEIPMAVTESELLDIDETLKALDATSIEDKVQAYLASEEEKFNPNEKMFYGGFLFCIGMPSINSFTGSVTDLYGVLKADTEVVGGKVTPAIRSAHSIAQDAQNIFKKIFG